MWSSEAVSVVRCDQRARRSVNETAMSDERAAQRRVECTLHAVVCDECRGRQLLPWSPLPHRQIAISTRRGATVSLHLCLCVLPTHVNRASSSCTASLFADDDDDDAGQSAVCSAPCSTPTARRRAASARRRPGVCTTRARRTSSSCVVGRRRALPARIGGARRQERRRVRAAARSRPSSSSLTRSALARARRRRRRHALLWATAAARWSSVPSSTATRCSSACSPSSADPRA